MGSTYDFLEMKRIAYKLSVGKREGPALALKTWV